MSENIRKKIKNYADWYESVYPELTNFGIWLKGGEINTLPAGAYKESKTRVLFARLSTYADTASSFTHSLLYQLASEVPGLFPDLAYLPPENDAKIFKKDGVPFLLGTNTKYGPDGFDIVGLSNSVIQEILNIPAVLSNSGIPLKKSERMERADVPIIIVGGANAIHTTSLWTGDPIVDGIFVGEDPVFIKKFFEKYVKIPGGTPKEKVLAELSGTRGFYVPDRPAITVKGSLGSSEEPEILEMGVVTYDPEEMGSGHLQVSEGCRALCSFCEESWTRKPYREFDPDFLAEKAAKLKAEMGLEKINIFSFNFNMYTSFYELMEKLIPLFSSVGLKSQRFDAIAAEPDLLEYQLLTGKGTFSCGLEGISGRLRKYLNKNIDDNALMKSLSLIFHSQARELKVFLLATGREGEEDLAEFGRLTDSVRRMKESVRARTRVIFSITPMVRFPWTPLEFEDAYAPVVLDKIIGKIIKMCENSGFEAREAMDTKEYLVSQILARASDGRIGESLIEALRKTEFVYYRNIPPFFTSCFVGELSKRGLDAGTLLKGADLDEAPRKIWADVQTGIDRKALWEMYQKNIGMEETPCVAVPGRDAFPASADRVRAIAEKNKKNVSPFRMRACLGESNRLLPRKYFGIALARAMMKADERLVPYFRRYGSSYWDADGTGEVWMTGDDVITLYWDAAAIPVLDDRLKDERFLDAVNKELGDRGSLKGAAGGEKGPYAVKIESPFKFRGAEYFKRHGIKYTLLRKKAAPGASYVYDIAKDAVKKRNIMSFSIVERTDGCVIEMKAGEKFSIDSFLKGSFECPQKNGRARIKAVSFEK